MALPTTTLVQAILPNIQSTAKSAKTQAQFALANLQAGSIGSTWVFNLLENLKRMISVLNGYAAVPGLNAYATANIPGYTGTMTTDIAATVAAAQACIDWVVANFPKDSTNTFILAQTLNSDGSLTERQFTSIQTAGLQTNLQSLISTIG